MSGIEQILSRTASKDNLRMWGMLYVSKVGDTVGGWLVDSWSENGAPYWRPKMHWLDTKENKLHHVYLNMDVGSIQTGNEDTDTEPERAQFIRATIAKWEEEWLEAGAQQ